MIKTTKEAEDEVITTSEGEEEAVEEVLKMDDQMKMQDSTRKFNALFVISLVMSRFSVGIGIRKLM